MKWVWKKGGSGEAARGKRKVGMEGKQMWNARGAEGGAEVKRWGKENEEVRWIKQSAGCRVRGGAEVKR